MNADSCDEESVYTVMSTVKVGTNCANQSMSSLSNGLTSRNRILISDQGTPVGRTNLSAQITEYCNRPCGSRSFNCNHNSPSISNCYTRGDSNLSIETYKGMQTKSFQPEDTTGNDNYFTQSDECFSVDVESRHHSQNSHRNNTEEYCRNVIGQETRYLPRTSKTVALESAPRERKRWIRPPLVGQASTSDNSAAVQEISFEAISNMGTEKDLRHSVRDGLLQPNYTEKKTDYSAAISVNMNESGLYKAFCTFDISSEVGDLTSYCSVQGEGDKAEACRDVRVLSEIQEDIEYGKGPENQDSLISGMSCMTVSSPVDTQHYTYSSSGQCADSSAKVIEAVGSGRAPSPASVSSATSNRRLEWDSGADVGYQNYQPEVGELPPIEGLSTIERIALARGHSAALRLDPEGIAGSVQQLNAAQFKPVTVRSKHISKGPVAVSTPVECGQTVANSSAGTESEDEIEPVMKSQADRHIFHGEGHGHLGEGKSTSLVQHHSQNTRKGEEGYNILSKKMSHSLIDLSEYGDHKVRKYVFPRSHSYLSLLSKEGYETKTFQYSNSGSFPLRCQRKRNGGLVTCSVSSSSIATVVPNHESRRISDNVIQTLGFHTSLRNSSGIQMFETEKDFKSLSMTSYFPCKQNDSALKHVGNSSVEQEVELEDTDSDVIDKTDSNMDEDINVKCIHNSKHTSDVKQNCTDVSQIGLQDISYQKRDHHKLQANKEIINQISALFKGPQNRGSNTHQWSSATGIQQTDSERHNETSQYIRVQVAEGKLNTEPLLQNYMKQREEQTTEKNSGMLDSITNSTQRVGSWFVGDTSQSANGNQNGSDGRGSSGVVGSANSFEYFPGHVYENNTSAVDTDLYQNTSTEDSSSESAQSHPSTGFVDNKFKKIVDKFWGSSNSLAADLEKSIALLKDISNLKLYNPAIKKKLVRQVVNKLIETNYAEDNALLESYVPAVPPVSHINPSGFVSDTVQVSQDGMSGGCKARRTMEREEVSGESANEQQGSSNILLSHHPATPSAASFIPEKCVGTSKALLPETSQMPSTSGSIPSTTQGCSCCSSTNTTLTRNGYAWKESPTQSEKEYEQRMHKPRHCGNKEVLLNVCEMERKSQLSWIHTEIRHLCNLKQLLEKPRCLRNSHLDRGMQTQKGNQRRRRNPITSENSEVSTEPESLSFRSDAACSSSANETHVKESENEHNTLTKLCHCKHTDQILELRSFKDPRKHGGTDQFGPEILHNPSDPHMKTASSNRGDISTKFPTSVVLCGKKDEHKLQLKEKAIQAPTSSNASTNGDMSVFMGDTLSESMAAGRINVFVQAVERQSTTEKDSLESEVSDINKNTIKASKSNEHGEITMKQPELNDCIPLCCCECQKLLTDIKLNKQRSVDKVSVDAHDKSSGAVGRWKYISSSRRTQSKNVEDSSARYHTLSSSGPLGGAVELTPDLHDVASSVSTETVRSIGVQTTQLVNSLPLRQPHSHSLYARWIEKKKSKAEKDMYASLKECPCCGILEDQTDVISESSNDNNCEWKCSRCLKMEQDQKRNRKCQICGTLESQLQMSHEDDISDHDINAWKCTDCIARESGNAEPGFDICIHCGLQKDCRTINTSSSKTKAPIGYVLTVETTTDSVSSMEESSEEKLLKEVKVSERKRHPVSAKGRRRGKLKRVVLESNIKSCSKGNEKPVGSMKNRSSNEDGFQRNRLYRREPTLQEYLIINRPDFIQSAEYRRQCLDELVYLRELRQKSRQKVLALACHRASFADGGSAASVNTGPLPPPPLDQKKMFSHRTMRAQTERKYHNLPEVLSKKVEKKRKEDYRTNRLMAEIFARKLQKRVLKGDVNLSSSRRVISII